MIRRHNDLYEAGKVAYRVGVNDLTYLSASERKSRYMGYSKTQHALYQQQSQQKNEVPIVNNSITVLTANGYETFTLDTPVDQLPLTVDWRKTGFTTPIKNQAGCGSCWAFGSIEVLEYYVNSIHGRYLTLSPEQINFCSENTDLCGGTGGCNGATAAIAYDYIINNSTGVTDAQFMPYYDGTNITCWTSDNSHEKFTCNEAKTGIAPNGENSTRLYASLTGYVTLPTNDYVSVMNAVAKIGPVVINIDATTTDDFSAYMGGVYTGCSNLYNTNTTDIDHVMTLEGYGTDPVYGDFYLLRNHWRSNWGEAGYMRIQRSANDGSNCDWDLTPEEGYECLGAPPALRVCGPCGMLSQSVFPVGAEYLNAQDSAPLYTDPNLINDQSSSDDNLQNTYMVVIIVMTSLSALLVALAVYLYAELKKASESKRLSSLEESNSYGIAVVKPPEGSASGVELP